MLKETPEGLSFNRIMHRSPGKSKGEIKLALRQLREIGKVERHTLTGEVAKYLQVPDGTEFYFLRD